MRIWSLHPSLLDRVGLVACWRETLLAQKVLQGLTRGYTRHPQLIRFRALDDPLAGISTYLWGLAHEARRRGYRFDTTKIGSPRDPTLRVELTTGQLAYEWAWLQAKLAVRAPSLAGTGEPRPHPMFNLVDGPIADWESAHQSEP
ncbi:MAG: pyrimidine dimer DNA glycosylase/endonuclease V [Propionibacteriaceae bacterium]|nr:pyrimidine dimer DNA glycosylase/endonuclease V [Propionibacteriaceae bacterium]